MKLGRMRDYKESIKRASRTSMYKRWDGWDDVTVCDNCGRKRQEARIYLNRKIDYYVWEREPYEIHKRDKINVNICEVCLAFVEERGKLP